MKSDKLWKWKIHLKKKKRKTAKTVCVCLCVCTYAHIYGLTYSDQIRYGNINGEGSVSRGGHTPS